MAVENQTYTSKLRKWFHQNMMREARRNEQIAKNPNGGCAAEKRRKAATVVEITISGLKHNDKVSWTIETLFYSCFHVVDVTSVESHCHEVTQCLVVLEKPFLVRSCSHQPACEPLAIYKMLTKLITFTYPRQKCHFRADSSPLDLCVVFFDATRAQISAASRSAASLKNDN